MNCAIRNYPERARRVYYAAVFEVKNEIPIYLPQKAILDKHESGLATLPTARRIFLKHLCLYAGAFLLLVSAGCTQHRVPPPHPGGERDLNKFFSVYPASSWHIQDPKINPLDGAKTQFLSTGSLEGKMEHHYISGLGDCRYKSTAEIVLCFENGKLCSGTSIGARIDIDGFVSSDSRSVRLKYDDGQPIRQRWSRQTVTIRYSPLVGRSSFSLAYSAIKGCILSSASMRKLRRLLHLSLKGCRTRCKRPD